MADFDLITFRCPGCGGQLRAGAGADTVTCRTCGSSVAVDGAALTRELIEARKERRSLDDRRREAERFRQARLDGARVKPLKKLIVCAVMWLGIWLGTFLAIGIARGILEAHTRPTAAWQIAAGVGPVVLATLWTGSIVLKGRRERRRIERAVREDREESAKLHPIEDAEIAARIESIERRLAKNRRTADG